MKGLAVPPTELTAHLQALVAIAKQYPPKSLERQKTLTQIIRHASKKLWKENVPYYNDALQQTWEHLCRNLDRYDSSKASLTTWLNVYLRWRLSDLAHRRTEIPFSQFQTNDNDPHPFTDQADPCPSDALTMLDTVREWASTDATGELRSLHIQDHPQVTAQYLILRRLPPETSWKALSEECGLTISTLSGFYRRCCLPRLRAFGTQEGYL